RGRRAGGAARRCAPDRLWRPGVARGDRVAGRARDAKLGARGRRAGDWPARRGRSVGASGRGRSARRPGPARTLGVEDGRALGRRGAGARPEERAATTVTAERRDQVGQAWWTQVARMYSPSMLDRHFVASPNASTDGLAGVVLATVVRYAKVVTTDA